jgi:plasmid stabilization system protein ParE
MTIVWSPLAIERMKEIVRYIGRDRPETAEKWAISVFAEVERLERFPGSGRVVPELKRADIREIIFGNYRIIYRLDMDRVIILTVRHGKQLLTVNNIPADRQ